jgi:hypothetical protein
MFFGKRNQITFFNEIYFFFERTWNCCVGLYYVIVDSFLEKKNKVDIKEYLIGWFFS